jgi:ribosomal protein S20
MHHNKSRNFSLRTLLKKFFAAHSHKSREECNREGKSWKLKP